MPGDGFLRGPVPFGAGFRVREVMDGTHEFVSREGPAGEFPFSFQLEWGADRLADFLNPFARDRYLTADAAGRIRVGGLTDEAACEGTLELRYLSEAKIRYRLAFEAEGQEYEYIGEKMGIRPWNLHRTHTTCYGVIYDLKTGKEISRSLSYFRIANLPSFLGSFRLVPAGAQRT